MKTKIYATIVFVLFTITTFSQSQIEREILKTENNLLPVNIFEGETPYTVNERLEYYQVPGISITVIKDFEVLWTKPYGYGDFQTKAPVTKQTLFNVGSLSKGLASLTVLSLIQKGMLNLDDNVNDYLKSWKIPQNEYTKVSNVTPRLLMNHSGGVSFHFGINYTRDNFPTITNYLNGEKPSREKPTVIDKMPGTVFQYSNPGYAILQQLTEDITGKDFYRVAEENVFKVLGMNQSTFLQPLSPEIEANASTGHRGYTQMKEKRYFYPNTAAGGLWTTSEDYAKFVIELMKSAKGKSNKVLSEKSVNEMLSAHANDVYGLGVFLRNIGEQEFFGHMGDNAGFFAGYLAHKTDGYGVIVLSNSNTSPELIREITKAVAKVYEWPEFLPKTIVPEKISATALKSFSGKYKSGSDDYLKVAYVKGDLILEEFGNQNMYYIGHNTFKIKQRSGEIKFINNDESNTFYAEYNFTDNLGRPGKTFRAFKMNEGEKTPHEYLDEGKTEIAENLYKSIFNENRQDPAVSENRLNRMGYAYINQNKIKQALVVLKLNTEFYPESSNCYDSYGEALALAGRKEDAVSNYQKAIELDPKAINAQNCLKNLKNK